jgi:hypothetical protein
LRLSPPTGETGPPRVPLSHGSDTLADALRLRIKRRGG